MRRNTLPLKTYGLPLFLGSLILALTGCQLYMLKNTPETHHGPGIDTIPNVNFGHIEMNRNYDEETRITFSEIGEDFDPYVFEGNKVLFSSTRISSKSDIFMKTAAGKVIEQITHTPNANEKQAQISPDGKRVVYASDKSGRYDIYESSFAVRGSREMEIIRNGRVNEQPCYSPDGRSLAYSTWLPRKGVWYIAIIDLMTQQERLYGPGLFPKFSPDGTKLLFQKPRTRVPQWYSVWILNLKTQRVSEIVSNNNWACVTPNWSPNGKKIIFAAINKNPGNSGPFTGDDIYTIWEDGTHLMRLTTDNAPDWNPIWSKDGTIYFISKRNGYQNLWSIKPKNNDRFHPDSVETSNTGSPAVQTTTTTQTSPAPSIVPPQDLSEKPNL